MKRLVMIFQIELVVALVVEMVVIGCRTSVVLGWERKEWPNVLMMDYLLEQYLPLRLPHHRLRLLHLVDLVVVSLVSDRT